MIYSAPDSSITITNTGSTVAGQCMEQRSGVPNGNALNVIVDRIVLTGSITDTEKNDCIACMPMIYRV